MSELVVVGGFGSSPEQMDYVAHRIGEHLDKDAIGINFRQASQDTKRLASLIEGKTVYTHSGGMQPVITSVEAFHRLPEQVISVAPPVPEQVRKLLWRGAMIGLGFSQIANEQLEQKFNATDELIHHPFANFRRIPSLGQFSAIAEVAHLQQGGVDTTVAFMEDDDLFDLSTPSAELSVERARTLGTKVVSVEGTHCRFTNDPVGTLAGIAMGQLFMPGRRVLDSNRQVIRPQLAVA